MERRKGISILLATAITLVIAALGFYFILPAINVHSQEFWILLTALVILWSVAYSLIGIKEKVKVTSKKSFSFSKSKFFIIAAVIPIAVLLVGNIVSSTFFNAVAYSEIIEVKDAVFEEDMPETNTVTNIDLMDSDSAIRIGNRTL